MHYYCKNSVSADEAERKDQEYTRVIVNHLITLHKSPMADMGSKMIRPFLPVWNKHLFTWSNIFLTIFHPNNFLNLHAKTV